MSTATFGTAKRPFRATLPLRVLRRLPRYEPEVEARMAAAALMEAAREPSSQGETAPRKSAITAQDVRYFLIAYIACFMAVSAWIS